MPLLYESAFRAQKVRPKSVSRQVYQEAPYWRVVEVYKVGSIYLTPDKLRATMKESLDNAAAQKGLKIVSYTILKEWAVWQGFWTDYYIRYEAYFGEASTMAVKSFVIPYAVIIICLTILIALVIILYIVLVAREVIEQIFNLVPPILKPAVATLLLVGFSVVAIGGGIYLITRALPKKKGA